MIYKNYARRTTCNGCIMKCNDHSSQELGTQKEHTSSKIENKKNESQKQIKAT
jgi:Fe-S-cluster-containing dehydrogenase component